MTTYPLGTLAIIHTATEAFGAQYSGPGWCGYLGGELVAVPDHEVLEVRLLHLPEPRLAHEDVVSAAEVMREHMTRQHNSVEDLDYYGAARVALLDYARKEQTR